jgi:hypothetical protein
VAAALIVGGGGAAFAYWTSSGSGTGTATTGTSETFVVTSEAPVGDPLVPGGPVQTVAFTVANESEASLQLNSVVVTVGNEDGSEWVTVPGCSELDYVVGTPVVDYGPIDGPGEVTGSVTISMVETGAPQDACKLAAVPLYFVAS